MDYSNDIKLQALLQLTHSRTFSKYQHHKKPELQLYNVKIEVLDNPVFKINKLRIDQILQMRLNNITINGIQKLQITIQTKNKKHRFFSEESDQKIKQFYMALTALIDI